MVMEVVQEDYGDDGSMQCTDHPYKNNSPAGGICAFCLQEKLGKLVSSSFPVTVFPSSSSSPSPSFRSDRSSSVLPVRTNDLSSTLSIAHNNNFHPYNHFKKSKIPFLLTHKKNKSKDSASDQNNSIVFKRSKSSVTPRRGVNFMDADDIHDIGTPHRRRFWSFMHLPRHSSSKISYPSSCSSASFSQQRARERKREEFVVVEENESPDQVSLDRKVSRSRSVGCGSRSFSGDLFERISTGFGDCTLRRVESQREGKSRARGGGANGNGQDYIKERVKCGGLFSGFTITSSSSSSSSSSYLVSSENYNSVSSKHSVAATAAGEAHGRSRSWGWAFASPIRAFKPSSGKRYGAAAAAAPANKNADAPNLAAIPSLLTVRN